jgi:hypothetical protein
MNQMKNSIAIIITLIILTSCKRDYIRVADYNIPPGNAYLRIIHASPSFSSIFNVPDTFNVSVGGQKITTYLPGGAPVLTYNNIYPNSSISNGYTVVPSGEQEVKLSIGVYNIDSVVIKKFTKTLVADNYYTLLITDSINSSRDAAQIFVRDSVFTPTAGYYNLRFVHAVWKDVSTTPKKVDTIDLFSTRSNRVIFSKIVPGTTTLFTTFGYNALLSDTFYVRSYRSTVNIDTLNNVSLSNQRNYTLYYRGDATLPYGNAKKTGLSVTVNK